MGTHLASSFALTGCVAKEARRLYVLLCDNLDSPLNLIGNPLYRNTLLKPRYKENLVALVDEAHCIKTWGDDFCVAFAHVGDIRSVISEEVHVMVLTATATRSTYDCILHCLSMKDVAVIAFPPNRSNIQYSVQTMTTIEDFSATMSSQLMKEGTDMAEEEVRQVPGTTSLGSKPAGVLSSGPVRECVNNRNEGEITNSICQGGKYTEAIDSNNSIWN
ncbi:uncharacterized protein LOC134195259 [Corticium candelabrum]|uniref:uncharacterized protein LOC134195259 n=1 Tax=Corticium candelabrum TaxID=121492 RepID=UPI002E26EEE1|nr:uncharacterized protein LOC134195259 [Corticium candelabrum]